MLTAATDANGTVWIGNGISRLMLADPAVFDRYCLIWPLQNVSRGPVRGFEDLGGPVDGATLEALGRAV